MKSDHRKVLGIVTDNAKNMKGAWKILQEKYNHLQPYGCVAHGLNLLAKDISSIESIAIIVNKGKEIVKEKPNICYLFNQDTTSQRHILEYNHTTL